MKKLILVIVAVALVAGGVVLGLKLKDSSSTNKSSDTDTATTITSGGKVLDLSNKALTKVDSSIYNKTDTTTLILSQNNLTSLPSEMGKMTKLQVLKLDHNKLEGSRIGEIRKMPRRLLDASYNNMTGIPAEIGQLNQLEELNYSYNQIDTLPNEIFKLSQLKKLDLTGNPMPLEKVQELRQKLPNTTIVI